jgi:deoxyribonuclease IV
MNLKIFNRFGPHVGKESTLTETLMSSGCDCCQFFMTGRGYSVNPISKSDKENACRFCRLNNMTFYVHCPYIINLASEDTEIRQKGKNSLKYHLKEMEGLPCSCVLHTGSGKISTVANELNSLCIVPTEGKRTARPLLLEVCAGEGKKIGRDADEIRRLFEALDHPDSKIGLCLDTQHVFASGWCDFRDHESVVRLFEDIHDSVGEHGLGMIHINDSIVPFGSKKDRHAPLGMGHIWNRDFESLCSVIQCADGVDTVLETQISELCIYKLAWCYSRFI